MRLSSPLLASFMMSSLVGDALPRVEPVRTTGLALEDRVVAEVDERYLSVAVDTAMVVGASFWTPGGEVETPGGTNPVPPYDFSRPKLAALARPLGPAYLRIGGSHADMVRYDMRGELDGPLPPGYAYTLSRSQWDSLNDFARAVGFDVVFTLNAGPGPRDESGAWTSNNARELMEYTVSRGYRVGVWELGNEPNGYPLFFGPSFWVGGEQLAQDYGVLRSLVRGVHPGARVAGPTSAYWPIIGEPGGLLPDFFDAGAGEHLDIVVWHYYPQQSSRCPVAVRRAGPETLLEPRRLDEVNRWAAEVELERDRHAPKAEVWLGETGHAQCGGAPGLSNAFVGGFWWLDQLGSMARRGQRVMVRQTLSGSDYGLLDERDLTPRPDYWTSVLWKRLMGTKVLAARTTSADWGLRLYAHCTKDGPPGAVSLAWVNLTPKGAVQLELGALGEHPRWVYALTADGLEDRAIRLNATKLALRADGSLPPLDGRAATGPTQEIPAGSYGFISFPNAGLTACR